MCSIRQYGIIILMMALIFSACQKSTVEPEGDEVMLSIPAEIRTTPLIAPFGVHLDSLNYVTKSMKLSSSDLARVMVADLSRYDDENVLLESTVYQDYIESRFSVIDRLFLWSEWEKLIGDRFTIVTNQTLEIRDGFVEGTVPGVVGFNRVFIAIIQNNRIVYTGEGNVIGVAGTTVDVEQAISEHERGIYWYH